MVNLDKTSNLGQNFASLNILIYRKLLPAIAGIIQVLQFLPSLFIDNEKSDHLYVVWQTNDSNNTHLYSQERTGAHHFRIQLWISCWLLRKFKNKRAWFFMSDSKNVSSTYRIKYLTKAYGTLLSEVSCRAGLSLIPWVAAYRQGGCLACCGCTFDSAEVHWFILCTRR